MKNLRTIGYFTRVIRQDGTLLFSPELKDSEFLLDIKTISHAEFLTEWTVETIKKVSKGFHIKLKEVNDSKTASFFINEIFAVPVEKVEGKSIDTFIGKSVMDLTGKVKGTVKSISKTPSYHIAEIEKSDGGIHFVPLTDDFVSMDSGKIILLKEDET